MDVLHHVQGLIKACLCDMRLIHVSCFNEAAACSVLPLTLLHALRWSSPMWTELFLTQQTWPCVRKSLTVCMDWTGMPATVSWGAQCSTDTLKDS